MIYHYAIIMLVLASIVQAFFMFLCVTLQDYIS
jgi:hypothetical protein